MNEQLSLTDQNLFISRQAAKIKTTSKTNLKNNS
jgi:hypothetical protein